MPCDLSSIIADVTLDCNDIPIGGLTAVYIVRNQHIASFTETDGELTAISFGTPNEVVNLEFNYKDGFSRFTDVKTVDDAGVVTAVPTVLVEFPKMTLAKRNAIELLTASGSELVAFIETAAGVRHAVGLDFGLWGSEANGQSGTGRSEKNKYDVKLEGEETNLARQIDDATWAAIQSNAKPIV